MKPLDFLANKMMGKGLWLALLTFYGANTVAAAGGKCLECYQCSSVLTDLLPACDDFYWHITSEKEKNNLLVACSPALSGYCIKKETNVTGTRITERGCAANVDARGNQLDHGCIRMPKSRDREETHICFCDEPKCNFACGGKSIGALVVTILNFVWLPKLD